MTSIYSTRFIKATTPGTFSFTVPDNQIAVVRCITLINAGSSGAVQAEVYVGGANVWQALLPAQPQAPADPWTTLVQDLRAVAESGELIQAVVPSNAAVMVSGYLFV